MLSFGTSSTSKEQKMAQKFASHPAKATKYRMLKIPDGEILTACFMGLNKCL
jgi:hypothetical protein